jgi:excinuclease ABC subunit C
VADPSTYRPRPGEIPTDPGVYRFRDAEGRVIYVGKAKNLRSRLSSYFQDLSALHHRTATMVRTGASVEWTVVSTEVEALQLEYAWIKEFDPRFNVRYRDDKSYPYLAVTMGEEFPRAMVMRGAKRKGTRYFGPYAHAWAIRETLDLAMRVFPMRTCSTGVFRRAGQVGRPCLLGYIDKCSAPCVGRVDPDRHREIAEDFCDFMAGESGRFLTRLNQEMKQAAAELDFERAARLRDDIGALERVLEKSAVVLPDATDADVFGLAEDELEVAVQLFHVRGGRVRGQRGWVAERDAESTAEVVEHLLQQVYGGESSEGVPREVLVPVLPDDAEALGAWLGGIRGHRVALRVPRRGDKRTLMETVARNASQSLARHKVTRAGDLTTRSQALQQLQEVLDLDDAPLRIECFDISHVQGTQVVGSMVVFEDGLARKSEYRRFIVRGDDAGATDDTAAMHEVLTRRFRRGRREADEAARETEETGRPGRFAYRPNLVVVDGGLPQVNAAVRALEDVGVVDIAVVGLAKRLEEVWVPGEEHPVVLPRTSEALYLLQRVRDEAHRFAVAFHRQRRSRAMTTSALDGIPGLGEKRRKALLARFGSVRTMRRATPEELAEVPGIGPALAAVVAAELGAGESAPAVNLATGEVVEDEGDRT